MGNNAIVVTICCTTYNHARYVRDALEGFMLQKTTFAFEIIIHDDASTDGTVEIIKEYEAKYPDLIKVIYQKENQYSKGRKPMINFVFPVARGKYLALCEGDDYWIDPFKLQKQVDFLEAHPDYGLSHGYCYLYDDNAKTFRPSFHEKKARYFLEGDIFESSLIDNCIITCSTFFRKDLALEYVKVEEQLANRFPMGDYPLWLELAKHSKVMYIDEPVAVYRLTGNSASCRKDRVKRKEFIRASFSVRRYFADKYRVSDAVIKRIELLEAKSDLSFAFQLNDKSEAQSVWQRLVTQLGQKPDLEMRLLYWGTRNAVSRFLVKIYKSLGTRVLLIQMSALDNKIRLRINEMKQARTTKPE